MRLLGKIWIQFLIVLVLFWVGGLVNFAMDLQALNETEDVSADGIVTLTGTNDRLELGFTLLKTGAAKRLLITGVHKQVNAKEIARVFGESETIMQCCVDIDHIAKDTVGNAYEASIWAAEQKFNSLIIVTSAYHMPRSLVELKRQMPTIKLYPYAVTGDNFAPDKWWKRPTTAFIVMSEYNKYIISLLRANLERLAMQGDLK